MGLAGFAQEEIIVVQVLGADGVLPVEAIDHISFVGVHHNNHVRAYLLRLQLGVIRVYTHTFYSTSKQP